MDEKLRGTGRTMNMLLSAAFLARSGRRVFCVFHKYEAARHAQREASGIITTRFDTGSVEFRSVFGAPRGYRGVVLYDHHLTELANEEDGVDYRRALADWSTVAA